MIRNVTSGPATATRNSCPGERVSLLIFMTPPKKNRSIPLTWMPSRRAASACPSSCSRIEAKKPKRGGDGGPERERRRQRVVEHALEPVDEQEQDDEPRDVDAYADAEDRRQPDRRAAEHWTSMVA